MFFQRPIFSFVSFCFVVVLTEIGKVEEELSFGGYGGNGMGFVKYLCI